MRTSPTLRLLLTLVLAGWTATSIAADSTNSSGAPLSVTNTVAANTTFKIFRRRPDNNYWDNNGRPYSYTNGIQLLRAFEKSQPWDGNRHGIAPGHTPPVDIELDWSRTKKERKTHSIVLCYGNRLFWYNDETYEIPEASYALVDRLFPKNK